MPNYFKSYADILTVTTQVTLLTVPATSSYIISSIVINNSSASTNSTISVRITDTTESTTVDLITDYSMLAGVSEEMLERPIILEDTDILLIQAADANIFDIYVSYMDKSRV